MTETGGAEIFSTSFPSKFKRTSVTGREEDEDEDRGGSSSMKPLRVHLVLRGSACFCLTGFPTDFERHQCYSR